MKKGIIIVCLLVGFASCYNDKYDQLYPVPPVKPSGNTCDTTTITYTNDIVPVLNHSCNIPGGCHDAAGSGTSGYNFNDTSVLKAQALNGSLLSDINFTPTGRHKSMPFNGSKLPQCTINKFTRWVNQGALIN